LRDQNIRWLDLAVDHSAVMRSLERIGNLGRDLQSSLQRHFLYATLAFAPFSQILPSDMLHQDIVRGGSSK
jgi:hypothetical protein